MKNQNEKKPIKSAYLDIQQKVTDTIIEQLEKGTVPWKKSFISNSNSFLGLPLNYTTEVNYRGINILLLWSKAIAENYSTNEWATLKQWNSQKEAIKPNEKGTMIVKYNVIEKEMDGKIEKQSFLTKAWVFNRCQLKGYESVPEENPITDNLVEKLDNIDEFITNTKVKIEHAGYEAFYTKIDDKVVMPQEENFIETEYCTATENYYSTLFHEIGHWTGHEHRLDRANHKKFADGNYAREELVAELTASFLSAKFEIANAELPNSAAYIGTWLKVLKDDKSFIFTSASEASKAVQYLENLQP
jgi:antirestriction protein ArdC